MSTTTARPGGPPRASLPIDCPRPKDPVPVSFLVNGTHAASKGDVVKCQALSKGGAVVVECRTCVLTTGRFTWCCKLNLDLATPDGTPIILRARLEDSGGTPLFGPVDVPVVVD